MVGTCSKFTYSFVCANAQQALAQTCIDTLNFHMAVHVLYPHWMQAAPAMKVEPAPVAPTGPAGLALHGAGGVCTAMPGAHPHHHNDHMAHGSASRGQLRGRDVAGGASMAAAAGAQCSSRANPNMATAGTHPFAQHAAPYVENDIGQGGWGRWDGGRTAGGGRASVHDRVGGPSEAQQPASVASQPGGLNPAACTNSSPTQVCGHAGCGVAWHAHDVPDVLVLGLLLIACHTEPARSHFNSS